MIDKIKSFKVVLNDYRHDSKMDKWVYGNLAVIKFTWDPGTNCWVPDSHQYWINHLFRTVLDLIDYLNEEYVDKNIEIIILTGAQVMATYTGSQYAENTYRQVVDKWHFMTENMLKYFVTELYLGGIHIM